MDESELRAAADAVDWALSTTRSVRRRIDWERPVAPEVIEAAIDVATQAPTGVQSENWRFLVLTEAEPKQAVAALYRSAFERYVAARTEASAASTEVATPSAAQAQLAERLAEMPALILVCAEGVPTSEVAALQVGFYGSILPAAWSLMVALRVRGIGSTWTSLHLLHAEETARALGIPEGVTQTVLLPCGYTKDATLRPAQRKRAPEITYWNRWGGSRG